MVLSYREVIRSSWTFTQNNKALMMWFSFFPSLLTTLAGIAYVTYQYFSFKNSNLFLQEYESFIGMVFRESLEFLQQEFEKGLIIGGIVIFLLLFYIFLPTLLHGGMIQLIARLYNNQQVKLTDGLYYGMISFLPLFEYHLMIRAFSFIGIFTELSFVIRNLGVDWFKFLIGIFILFAIIGLVFSILFIYTEYFIVIDHQGVIASIISSSKLVLRHWQETFLILIIMAIITIQILFRVAMIILVPVIITYSSSYLISFEILKSAGLYIGFSLGIIALYFAAYLGGTITVFATTVWVETFLKLTQKIETSAREQNTGIFVETSPQQAQH